MYQLYGALIMPYLKIAGVVIGSALKKPSTRRYPFEIHADIAGSRGAIAIDIQKCTMCTLCQKKCPTAAIVVKRTEKTWEIDRLRCIQCGACVDCCPKDCLTMSTHYSPSQTERTIDSFIQKPVLAAEATDTK